MKSPSNSTMHEVRLRKYLGQRGLCWLCDEPLDLFQPSNRYGGSSWEHIVPRSSGGSNRWENIALTHWECNKLRGDRLIWRLTRPRTLMMFHRPNAVKLQAHFERQVLPRLKRLLA